MILLRRMIIFVYNLIRVVVDEYVDNGNLGQWLHDCTSEVSPLTWNMRMNIVLGIAKGCVF